MKKKFNYCVLFCAIIFISCSREDIQKISSNKGNKITNTPIFKNKFDNNIKHKKQDNSINVNKIKKDIKKYDKLWDLLTTGGTNNTNLTESEKIVRIKAYDVMNKTVNKTNFFSLEYDEEYISLTNRILTDIEIQLLINNLDIPTLIEKAGSLYLGYEMIRDIYASQKLLEYVIKEGNDTEQLYAIRKLAEFSILPFVKGRNVPQAILLHKKIINFLSNNNYQISDFDYGLNFGWTMVGLAQCYNALEKPDKEKEVYEKLANYLKEKQLKSEEKIALSIPFAKNIVTYREKLPNTSKGLEQLAGKFDDIFNKINDKNNSPLARKCTGIAKELRRKAKLIKVNNNQ